jgi:hypothetical protein
MRLNFAAQQVSNFPINAEAQSGEIAISAIYQVIRGSLARQPCQRSGGSLRLDRPSAYRNAEALLAISETGTQD